MYFDLLSGSDYQRHIVPVHAHRCCIQPCCALHTTLESDTSDPRMRHRALSGLSFDNSSLSQLGGVVSGAGPTSMDPSPASCFRQFDFLKPVLMGLKLNILYIGLAVAGELGIGTRPHLLLHLRKCYQRLHGIVKGAMMLDELADPFRQT
ncbi:hypothetical protein EYF80_026106 [Liparis tanakae]|uniref:Uncharacterized protein n=1 Tax=Liparis tanakae TaxID=230148 RepID=A0A4Z2HCU5_9TELE|nr:hypothetical protein EYF80_026106 [Liparis tanakae]